MDSTARWEKCNQYLDQCINLYSQSSSPAVPVAYFWKGYIQQYNYSNWSAAIDAYQKEVTLWPQNKYSPNVQLEMGKCYYYLGDYAKAINAYQQLIQNYPDSPLVNNARESIATIQGKINNGNP